MGFGDRLRTARLAAGLTQAELAQLVGVADGTRVAAWERGRSTPRPLTLVKLRKVLDLSYPDEPRPQAPLAATLRELRLARNMTTEELADLLQVHETTVVRWESGATKPRRNMLRRVAEVFGIGVNELPQ